MTWNMDTTLRRQLHHHQNKTKADRDRKQVHPHLSIQAWLPRYLLLNFHIAVGHGYQKHLQVLWAGSQGKQHGDHIIDTLEPGVSVSGW